MFNKIFILKDTVVLPQFAKLCYLLNKLRTLRKKYVIFVKLEKIDQINAFSTNFTKGKKGCHFTVKGDKNLKLTAKVSF